MKRTAFLLVSLLMFAVSTASAQSMYGSLTGTVMDSAGAAIYGADVTVKDASSGVTRKSVTNREGFFSLSTLPASTYEVVVAAKGFATYDATGIALNGSDIRTMNIELKVGAISEVVEVHGATTDVAPVDSGEKSALLSAKDLQRLSLVSRDAAELVKLLPGSILSANNAENRLSASGETVGLNVDGPLKNSNINGQWVDVTLDGGHTFDPGANGNSSPVTANQDMISEIKVLTSNFTADNAKGPVVVNAITKSGGKTFHGDARFYARNGVMNANDANAKASHVERPSSSYYYPGFGIGGPVLIPGTDFNKSRNKIFFYEGFEYYKQQVDFGVERAFVMTPDMLNGDFSALSGYSNPPSGLNAGVVPTQPDWATGFNGSPWRAHDSTQSVSGARLQGCTVTGGVLSSDCIDPNAQALLKAYLPSPTTPNGAPDADGFNYIKDFVTPLNANQNLARVDVNISDNTKMFVTYNRERQTANWALGLWGGQAADNAVPSPTAVIGADRSDFVSATFLHVFSPTMTSETRFSYTHLDFPESPVDPTKLLRADIPNFNLKGVFGPKSAPMVVTWGSGFPNLGAIGNAFHPNFTCYSNIPSFAEDITKVFGTHTTKYGVYLERIYHTQDNWSQFMGAIGYSGWDPSVTGNIYADALTGIGHGSYFEQVQPPNPIPINDNVLTFYAQDSWKVSRRLTLQYGMRFEHYAKPYSPGYGMAIFDPTKYSDDPKQLDNNTGVSWHSMDHSIPLSGASSRTLFFSPRFGAAFDVFGTGKTVVRGGWGKYRAYDSVQNNGYTGPAQTSVGSYGWTCGQNDPLCPSWEDVDTHAITPVFGQGLGPGLKSITTMDRLDDEQPLVTTYSLSIDQTLPGRLGAEISYVGNRSSHQQPQLNFNAVPIGTLLNVTCTITDTSCQDANRPRHNYESITNSMNAGRSRFDSLQATLHRNVGFATLMLNYTFSKALGDDILGTATSGYADYGVREFYGVSSINRAHVLSAAYVFRLPSFRGSNAFARGALGGWEISGITQIESGANLTSVGGFGGSGWNFNTSLSPTAADVEQTNLELLGTPDVQLQPVITCNPKHGLKPGYYLNPDCFAPPPGNGVNGSGRMPYLPGPMFWNSDLTALKNIRIGEHQSLQFRVAAFDFLNHDLPSFKSGDNNLQLGFDSNGKAPSTFGQASTRFGHRIIELGLKYSF